MEGRKEVKKPQNEYKLTLIIVEAYDHFSTEQPESEMECIVRMIGELVGENKYYLFLRHIKADIDNEDSAEEVHAIFKPAIKKRVDKVIEWGEKNNEEIQIPHYIQ